MQTRKKHTILFQWMILAVIGCATFQFSGASATDSGPFVFQLRSIEQAPDGEDAIVFKEVEWKPSETAVLICDVWDRHWCASATRRVGEVAPRINEFASKARARGALVVHAPSGTMEFYKNHPARKLAQNAPRAANLPDGIQNWRNAIDDREKNAEWPVDQSDGGCDCPTKCKQGTAWSSQTPEIEIEPGDAVSDSGEEIWNLFEASGIKNVLMTGVHTNMCVVGRPFGLRNLSRFGKNVALARDLTDTMYDPRQRPNVGHFAGTGRVVDHIEKYICPTVTSSAITGKPAFRFKNDRRPRVVCLIAETEYQTARELPRFARKLEREWGLHVECLVNNDPERGGTSLARHRVPGMVAVEGADLVILSARRRALPAEDMRRFRDHLDGGGPLVAIRTSSHAFDAKAPVPGASEGEFLAQWPEFDNEVLGCDYKGHYGQIDGGTRVELVPGGIVGAGGHPILAGVALEGFRCPNSSLYQSRPLGASTEVLLTGSIPNKPAEPVAWTNKYKNARVFCTSMGHWEDWKVVAFDRMMTNAVFWGLGTVLGAA